jgi:16S rRNA (guanine527-N7)-methyltransferase
MKNQEQETAIPDFTLDLSRHQTVLQAGCEELDLTLSPDQLAQFERYYRELVAWNRRFNLTAITDEKDVQIKHFLDCLAGLPLLAEELRESLPLTRPLSLVDVGAGAGFPGLPLKIAAPALSLSLIDGTGKKIRFLNQMVDALRLTNVTVVQGRAEELGRQAIYRAQYDLVTARAVAPLNTLVEYLLPLVRMGGLVVIYKGGNAPQEFVAARKAIDLLGGESVRLAPVKVPFLAADRFILLVKKVRRTPEQYPRGQGLARKKPL